MAKTFTLSVIFLTTLFLSCKKKDIENEKIYYRAIKGKDTALLSMRTYKDCFYGEFEMIYGKRGKDSGVHTKKWTRNEGTLEH